MKIVLWILGVLALLLVLLGAVNRATLVSLDYVVGTTGPVSLFWVALVGAAAVLVAGLAGWAAGAARAGGARAKLERELEATYRRLRESQARAAATPAGGTAVADADAATAAAPNAVTPEAGSAPGGRDAPA
ncbi:MAG TPA: hypothetical protein PLK79_03270 [Thermoleophilia bacterium]|nr:hypothetical protein [Thermoleophilia bacterium]